ncbi:MAG: hypothetical protein M4579_000697 [Chaenotheca gracillima]|nr:MAG: hypothetical protein M4579_000697 [Chaenotheca gracillima]
MPPKKKARLSPPSASTPQQDVAGVETATPTAPETPGNRDVVGSELTLDPWTDDQEITLFKGLIRWKPAGMHKNFRMIALSQFMREHGYASARSPHTRTPGIWKKLESLYDLDAIDEREDAFLEADESARDTEHETFYPFVLPNDEYLDMQLEKAVNPEGTASPPVLEKPKPSKRGGKANRASGRATRASTIEDTEEEPRSSPMPGRGGRGGRSARAVKQTPKARVQAEARASSTRRGTKIPTPTDEDAGASEDNTNEEDEEEDEDEEEGDDSTTGGSPSVRTRRNPAKPGRGGGAKRQGRGGSDRRRSTRKR